MIKPDSLELDPGKVALLVNRGRSMPRLEQAMSDMLPLAGSLIEPRAAYELIEVLGVDGELVRFRCGAEESLEIKLGPKADLLAPANMALAAVATIGPRLEAEVKLISGRGDVFGSYVLDCLGVAYLNMLGKHVIRLAEETAAQKGWGVGRRLAPGSLVGWELKGQREICRMVPASEIGVSLNSSGMLAPVKSGTAMIGLGPDYPDNEVKRVCKFCSLQDTCWTRRL